MRKKGLILIMVVSFLNLFSISSADIWKKHINSNRAEEIICNEQEVWIRAQSGGLTRWDTETGEPERFYEDVGFPSNSVYGFAYDDEDRLLAVVSGDIYKFDGVSYEYITTAPVSDSFVFSDGNIICGSRYGYGVHRYDGENWQEMTVFTGYNVYTMTADPDGGFWFSADNNGSRMLIKYKDGDFEITNQSTVMGIPGMDIKSSIRAIHIDADGIVWACIGGGIAWYDCSEWKQYYWDNETFRNGPANVTKDNDGIVWLAREAFGLVRYDWNEWQDVPEYEDIRVEWVEKDPRGGIWVGTEECLEHFDGIDRIKYKIDNLLPISNRLSATTIDNEGNLWCGDTYGDIAFLNRNTWNHLRGRIIIDVETSSDLELKCLKVSETTGIWAGFTRHILRYQDNLWMEYTDILSPEIKLGYKNILESPEGDIWISGMGFARFHEGEWEFHKPTNMRYRYGNNVISFDRDGSLWAAGLEGIWRYDGLNWKRIYKYNDFERECFPNMLFCMNDGTIWSGSDNAIVVFNEDEIIHYFDEDDGLQKLPYNASFGVSDMCQGSDESIWIIMSAGLVHYDGVQFKTYTEGDAGFRFGSSDFAIDSDGRIFIISNSGLTEFTPTSVTLKMNLFAPGLMYNAGDTFSLSLNVNNYGPDETGDLYFVMMTPDGKLYSGLDWSEGVIPAGKNIMIPEGFAMPMIEALKVKLPVNKPPIAMPGKYYFALALADSGTSYFRAKAITSIDVVE